MELDRCGAVGLRAVSLRTLGSHRRSLGVGPGQFRSAARLCAGARRLYRGCRDRPVGTGRNRAGGWLVPAGTGRGVLAELYPRPDLYPQCQHRQCQRDQYHRNKNDRDGAANGRSAATGGEPAIRQPRRGNRRARTGICRFRQSGTCSACGSPAGITESAGQPRPAAVDADHCKTGLSSAHRVHTGGTVGAWTCCASYAAGARASTRESAGPTEFQRSGSRPERPSRAPPTSPTTAASNAGYTRAGSPSRPTEFPESRSRGRRSRAACGDTAAGTDGIGSPRARSFSGPAEFLETRSHGRRSRAACGDTAAGADGIGSAHAGSSSGPTELLTSRSRGRR
jgi:hypothetical protein